MGSCWKLRGMNLGASVGGLLDVTEPDAVGRRRGLDAVRRMMACVAR